MCGTCLEQNMKHHETHCNNGRCARGLRGNSTISLSQWRRFEGSNSFPPIGRANIQQHKATVNTIATERGFTGLQLFICGESLWRPVTQYWFGMVWGCFLTARLSSSRAQAPLILEGRRGKVPVEKNQFENMFKLFKPVFLCFCRKIALLGLYKNYKISKAFASWCFVC